jgi:hypothetical protein
MQGCDVILKRERNLRIIVSIFQRLESVDISAGSGPIHRCPINAILLYASKARPVLTALVDSSYLALA